MPIYRAKVKCFVGQSMREPDEEFEYNGEFNSNIELVGGTEPDLPVASNTTVPSEEVKPTIQSIDYESMTKAELEVYGRSIGIELDRRQTKETLISQLETAGKYVFVFLSFYRGLVVILLTSSFYRRCNGN